MLYVEADSSGADSWKLEPIVDLLKQGAVGVIPTDTLYVALRPLTTPSLLRFCLSYFKAASRVIA